MIIKDEESLRKACADVLPEEIDSLREKLEAELKRAFELGRAGIGLAAPQIGIHKKIAIVRVQGNMGTSFNVDLVNDCSIGAGYDLNYIEKEGCLSFPGMFVKTRRYKEIYVVNNGVEPKNFIATGLFAICIQHELDHLRGILLPDVAV